MNTTDGDLLRRYVRDHSEAAFEELTRRHLGLVYSAALRQVNHNTHLAEDVTQLVFTDLARKAARLLRHTSLTGWLYTSTRYAAASVRRTESRRSVREQEACAMQKLQLTEPQLDWTRISPLLDEAMHSLSEADREAVLLRHFEQRSYSEIGDHFGIGENAARMRVDRALDKLQAALARQGITSTALALAGVLSANAVGTFPATLISSISRNALATATGGIFAAFSSFFSSWIVKSAAVILMATIGLTIFKAAQPKPNLISKEVAVGGVFEEQKPTASILNAASTTNGGALVAVRVIEMSGQALHLKIVATDSGKPVPNVPMDMRVWANGKFNGAKHPVSDRFGNCLISYPPNVTRLEITTRIDDFADTQLLWTPQNGDLVPTNYLLRLDRPVAIGGHVVDADGNPVAGAKVGWNHEDDPGSVKLPQSHEFGWIEVSTDSNGRWRINRIAEDMLWRIYGSARETNHVDSKMIWPARNASDLKQLREQTFLFHLGRPITVHGVVVDDDDAPVVGANILVGGVAESGRRESISEMDGSFTVRGCKPGKQTITAEADGYAVTSMKAVLSDTSGPICLKLQRGKLLRLRVVDRNDLPLRKASVWLNTFENGSIEKNRPTIPQVEFEGKTDAEGRLVWSNAPDAELNFDVSAAKHTRVYGVKMRPDAEEHIVRLPDAVIVHGTVRDADTGDLIPKFRMITGWPEWNPMDNSTNAQWSRFSRDWLPFANGTYHHAFEEPLILGTKNPGYMLKFEADGYASFVTRSIGPDEGDVRLDVVLHRAAVVTATVYTPSGQLARNAEAGFVFPGARLSLVPGGFSNNFNRNGGSVVRTDKNGTFQLPADESISRIIVASPDGYAETTPAKLTEYPVIQLQSWGKLELTSYSGGKPAVGREYILEFENGSPETVSFDFTRSRFKTDGEGRVIIEKMPLGRHAVAPLYVSSTTPDNVTSWTPGQEKTFFEINPGTTTSVSLNSSDWTINASIRWPEGTHLKKGWNVLASLQSRIPWPANALTNEFARNAYLQSPEFLKLRKTLKYYPIEVKDAKTITIDHIAKGNYEIGVSVIDGPAIFTLNPGQSPPKVTCVLQGNLPVTVPKEPGNGVIDAGSVELHSVKQAK
ncbi:MAG TPA: sigma-70 family RNA polymerase sigma factor, partial [Verrucomicrobiae bacterium]|nr:sigma-70 family RNA polymerase sigma factor [Verrucomicrobiae bacterium]